MVLPPDRLRSLGRLATCTALAVGLSLVSHATTTDPILVWRIGSPHRGDTPQTAVPFTLRREATRRGYGISVEAFPAIGFAAKFRDAVMRHEAPDVLVFDNHGIMSGITTALGSFDGVGEEPTFRQQFVRVTGAFDELLGPQRGWTYLFSSSRNHQAARALALRPPECPSGSYVPTSDRELPEIVAKLATAYLNGDASGVIALSDPDRLPARSSRQPVTVGALQHCGVWGNGKLAFASVNVSYDGETTIGQTQVLLVLRKPFAQWQLLAAARDPISTDGFVKHVASMSALLAGDLTTGTMPEPATLLTLPVGNRTRPASGQRFGTFTWRSSPSEDVVAEIVEFAYHDDARLFVELPARPNARSEISAGRLWTTHSEWTWRIWSVSRAGDVAFSDTRTFTH